MRSDVKGANQRARCGKHMSSTVTRDIWIALGRTTRLNLKKKRLVPR
jgi:hypothetical protein